MFSLKIFPILIAIPLLVSASVWLKSCSEMKIKAVDDFEINKFTGSWFEIKRIPNPFEVGTCGTIKYTLFNTSFIKLEKHHLVAGNITNTLEGYAWPQEPDKENGKFWMKFSLFHGKAPHWVIGTDYEKYSIIWSCYDVISVKSTALSYQMSWILSRNPQLSSKAAAAVDEIINSKLNSIYFTQTEQSPIVCGRIAVPAYTT